MFGPTHIIASQSRAYDTSILLGILPGQFLIIGSKRVATDRKHLAMLGIE